MIPVYPGIGTGVFTGVCNWYNLNRIMQLDTGEIVDLLLKYKYLILFPIAFLEGPAIAVIAGFLIAMKVMTFWPVYAILVAANIIGDVVYYLIGRLVPRNKLDNTLRFFRIKDSQVKKAEKVFHKNRRTAIILGKVTHAIGAIFLIVAGMLKIPFREYIGMGLTVELPKALLFVFIGYYFGRTVSNLDQVINYSIGGFLIFTLVVIAIVHFVGKYTDSKVEKLEKEML